MSNWLGEADITSWETLEEDVFACMEEFCEKEGMLVGELTVNEVVEKMRQNVWAACVKHVGDRLFKRREFFKIKINGNVRQYDREKILRGVEFYVGLCQRYDKLCELAGLTGFLGVGRNFFEFNGENSAIGDALDIRKYIYQASEDTATGLLVGGSRAPMAVLPYLNHKHGWDKGQAVEVKSQAVLSGSELPRLGVNNGGDE